MTDREKVLQALEHCDLCSDMPNCPVCAYLREPNCMEHMKRDIIALLKAQEPRVMKVGDVRTWVNSDRVMREPIVIEIRGGVCGWIVDDEVRELPGEANLSSDLYDKTWRCWTSRPTDEQREATPWET